ncbi:MAG TPA: MotA/TolQ/ExbB proton channel family protein [Candidatus Polarisedimenticolia bacterium]|nr:MotA/TolQ/ExbB proton channel family protein [Candidatus Polarisedimenticolia bacterium]
MSSHLTEFWFGLGWAPQLVIVLLGVMSMASIAVVVERGVGIWMARRDSRRFVPLATAAFESGIFGEVAPLMEKCSLSPEAELVRRSGVDLDSPPATEGDANRQLLLARWSLDRYLEGLNLDLRRGLPVLGTIAATAPFVGLLGTVLGIIRAFQALGTTGTGLSGVSAGIAEALITTAMGLFVAIPATWAFNFITSRVDGVVFHARRFATLYIESLAATGGPSTRKLLSEKHEENPAAVHFSRSAIKADINVTPLVDVVLVLLIIFMVITPAPESAIEVGIAKNSHAPGLQEKNRQQVLVRVTADNQVFLNDQTVQAGSLKEALVKAFHGKTDLPLFFEADANADYPQVVRILDEVSTAGYANISLVNRRPATP